ncbi:hybrid sensor histidine kinase/response regulator [Nibricoccus aquaticus]|nr:response regulator [Nibricoccus aquaticus]
MHTLPPPSLPASDPQHVLIIDDDPLMREYMAFNLSADGYTVFEASSAREGLDMCQRLSVDVIISDIVMEGADGYEILDALRAKTATATIPLILITASGGQKDVRKAMSRGADDFLHKPFSVDELRSAVQAQLRKRAELKNQAERALLELRASISLAFPHELNTPLNGIIGCAEIIKIDAHEANPAGLIEMADNIIVSAQRLQRLTDRFLAFASTELIALNAAELAKARALRTSGPAELIATIAARIAADYKRAADLTVEKAPGTLAISTDFVSRIAGEIIDNAFKFSKPGTHVRVLMECNPVGYSIRIVDQGRGMSPEQIARIGSYSQFDRKKYAHEGLGLGLVTAQRIADLHGGYLQVESCAGGGCTVTIQLPLVPEPASIVTASR